MSEKQKRNIQCSDQVDVKIVDDPKSINIVRHLVKMVERKDNYIQHPVKISERTKIAMSVINILLESGVIKNVLCIVESPKSIKQAKSIAKEFFKPPMKDLRESKDFPNGFYFSTVQNLRDRKKSTRLSEDKLNQKSIDLIIFYGTHGIYCDINELIHKLLI